MLLLAEILLVLNPNERSATSLLVKVCLVALCFEVFAYGSTFHVIFCPRSLVIPYFLVFTSEVFQAAKINPCCSRIFLRLGESLAPTNRQKAIQCLERAAKIRPTSFEVCRLFFVG